MAKRKGKHWFISGINGENFSKEFILDLSFIHKNGIIITDEINGKWLSNTVVPSKKVMVKLLPFGGFVMKF